MLDPPREIRLYRKPAEEECYEDAAWDSFDVSETAEATKHKARVTPDTSDWDRDN